MVLAVSLSGMLACFASCNLFSCNHARTPVNEGKCYCPDCGRGLVFHWVVLRCIECKTRRDGRYFLRGLIPAERCCLYCGTEAVSLETLDSPGYFQLQKAKLLATEEHAYEQDYLRYRVRPFSLGTFGETMVRQARRHFEETLRQTRRLLSPPSPPALAYLPLTPP